MENVELHLISGPLDDYCDDDDDKADDDDYYNDDDDAKLLETRYLGVYKNLFTDFIGDR